MALDYSLIVTWSYFALYMIGFLIVSIICAIKIRKQWKENKSQVEINPDQKKMSKRSALVLWAKLLWKKKKVYLQLVPHFFDQATDFGVIFEFWRLHQDGKDAGGLNTLYLFGVSIGVIVLHRIVSSIAVYRLTKNWIYCILQVFDALMIQCVWTNYQMDTDEPSNAQRYLQVLEATFEVRFDNIY